LPYASRKAARARARSDSTAFSVSPHAAAISATLRRSRYFIRNTRSARFYKIINEVPAVLMVLIVILVKVQPFSD